MTQITITRDDKAQMTAEINETFTRGSQLSEEKTHGQ